MLRSLHRTILSMATGGESISDVSEVNSDREDDEDNSLGISESNDSTTGTCENCQKAAYDHTIVLVENIGGITPYVIPSFPFVTVRLMHIKFQVYGEDETVYDGFLGAEEECSVSAVHEGSVLRICHGHNNAFLINQEEFSKSIVTAGMVLIDNSLVFVIWKWCPVFEVNKDNDEDVNMSCELQADKEDEDDEEDESNSVIHALTFKCIGTIKEERYQEILVAANLQRRNGEEVHVRLTPEPTNCYDSEAIAFECKTSTSTDSENKWERIGYMVCEVLQDVHEAIRSNSILSVQFDWIRFITHWSRSKPGWYCGIRISKVGPWSKTCLKHRSSI